MNMTHLVFAFVLVLVSLVPTICVWAYLGQRAAERAATKRIEHGVPMSRWIKPDKILVGHMAAMFGFLIAWIVVASVLAWGIVRPVSAIGVLVPVMVVLMGTTSFVVVAINASFTINRQVKEAHTQVAQPTSVSS